MKELLDVFNSQTSLLIEENDKSFKQFIWISFIIFVFTVIVFLKPDILERSLNININAIKDTLPKILPFELYLGSLLMLSIKVAVAKHNKIKYYQKIRKTLVLVSMQSENNETQVKELIWKAIEKLTLE
jgi:hypothetical protein